MTATLDPSTSAKRTKAIWSDWRFVGGGFILSLFVLIATFGPMIVSYNSTKVNTRDRLLAPLSEASDGSRIWLGTDELGRDIAAQVIQGARVSLTVGIATVLIAGVIGVILGILAGYYGGWVDAAVSRAIELQLAVPPFLLAILVASVLGPSLTNLVLVLALTRWVKFARVSRGSALALREQTYVKAGVVLGISDRRILAAYILPMSLTPLVILTTVEFGLVILAEAGLSFLGLGAPLSTPSWGPLIATGRQFIDAAWWISVIPGLCLVLVGVSAGLLGDGLRDRLDPEVNV